MMNKRLIYMLGLILLLNNCKNDLEVVDDWKENMVIYGILNQADTAQYIRINKVYLGEGDATQMAQVYDSIYYDTTKIEVKLIKFKNNSAVTTYYLQPDKSIQKDPGTFLYPNQLLYKLKTTGTSRLDSSCEYHLEIKNKVSGYTAKAKASLMNNLSISAPVTASVDYSYTSTTSPGVKAAWTTTANGRLYGVTIRFHYTEYTASDTIQKYADWTFANQRSNSVSGGEDMSVTALNSEFFSNIKSKVSNNGAVLKRVPKNTVEFIFSIAADELATYIEVSTPSTGIIQDRPTYTNIENGLGIFSARYTKKLTKTLSAKSMDELFNGTYTSGLKFCSGSTIGSNQCAF